MTNVSQIGPKILLKLVHTLYIMKLSEMLTLLPHPISHHRLPLLLSRLPGRKSCPKIPKVLLPGGVLLQIVPDALFSSPNYLSYFNII